MTNKIAEHTINFYEHFPDGEEGNVKFMISGFIPTYDPLFVQKGRPETMTVLAEKLGNLLGVHIKVSEPSNADKL
jgi:hypothetical protein